MFMISTNHIYIFLQYTSPDFDREFANIYPLYVYICMKIKALHTVQKASQILAEFQAAEFPSHHGQRARGPFWKYFRIQMEEFQ